MLLYSEIDQKAKVRDMCLIRLIRCLDCDSVSRPPLCKPKSSCASVVFVTDVLCNNPFCQRAAQAIRADKKSPARYRWSDCVNPTCSEETCAIEYLSASCKACWTLSPQNFLPVQSLSYLPGEGIFFVAIGKKENKRVVKRYINLLS